MCRLRVPQTPLFHSSLGDAGHRYGFGMFQKVLVMIQDTWYHQIVKKHSLGFPNHMDKLIMTFSSSENEDIQGKDVRDLCKSNQTISICAHLCGVSIGNSTGCNEGLLR